VHKVKLDLRVLQVLRVQLDRRALKVFREI
jgi:hypothetical protein